MPKTIREVVVAYNKAARLYDLMNLLYFFGRDKRFRSMLVEKLAVDADDTVLNLCCGTGLDLPFLLQKIKIEGTLMGVDLSSEMLQRAKKKIGSERVNLVKSDAAHLAFRDKTFDAVLASFCLEITSSYEKAIEEAARVLKPHGRIGILANNKPSGGLWLLGVIVTKVVGAMAKIDFEVDLTEHLSKKFVIAEERKMYGGLVRFLVGEKIQ